MRISYNAQLRDLQQLAYVCHASQHFVILASEPYSTALICKAGTSVVLQPLHTSAHRVNETPVQVLDTSNCPCHCFTETPTMPHPMLKCETHRLSGRRDVLQPGDD